jgi:hypothetical protein
MTYNKKQQEIRNETSEYIKAIFYTYITLTLFCAIIPKFWQYGATISAIVFTLILFIFFEGIKNIIKNRG